MNDGNGLELNPAAGSRKCLNKTFSFPSHPREPDLDASVGEMGGVSAPPSPPVHGGGTAVSSSTPAPPRGAARGTWEAARWGRGPPQAAPLVFCFLSGSLPCGPRPVPCPRAFLPCRRRASLTAGGRAGRTLSRRRGPPLWAGNACPPVPGAAGGSCLDSGH